MDRYITEITIPKGITDIGDFAFYGCADLTSVTIPNGVTTIGDTAFCDCVGLTSITIPEGTTKIGSAAFSGCPGLRMIALPVSIKEIGADAFSVGGYNIPGKPYYSYGYYDLAVPYRQIFYAGTEKQWEQVKKYNGFHPDYYNCLIENGIVYNREKAVVYAVFDRTITSAALPDSVTSISKAAFYDCAGLTDVTLPDGMKSIGEGAFYGCAGLARVSIPNGVTSIGNAAFYGCESLTEAAIPDSVTEFGDYVFSGCTGLADVIIGNGVTSIGNYVLSGCTGLTGVTIGDGLASIGGEEYGRWSNSVFSACTALETATIGKAIERFTLEELGLPKGNLKTVVIRDGATSIKAAAFAGSYSSGYANLTSVTIPDSVIGIGEKAFSGCEGLKKVHIGSLQAWCGISFADPTANPLDHAPLLYLNGNEATEPVIPEGVTAIGKYAFYGYKGLTGITLPASVTSVDPSAFTGCTGLKSFAVAEGNPAYTAENGILYNKDKTELVRYPAAKEGAETDLPETVTALAEEAFADNRNLTAIRIPSRVNSLGNSCFARCRNLKTAVCGSGAAVLPERMFADCPALVAVTVPYGVSRIGGRRSPAAPR